MTLRIIMVTAEEAPFGGFWGVNAGSGPKADSPSHLKHRGGDARVQWRDPDNESVSVLRRFCGIVRILSSTLAVDVGRGHVAC